jgi:mannose-6-phosphate isomerase-like protein (cupin superfamily)
MILVSGEQTEGRLGMIEDVIPAGHVGPRLHLHPRFDEGFYVLEGELAFQLRETIVDVGPGEVVLARRGEPHAFANRTDRAARVLMFVTPAGFERFFAEGAARAAPPEEETIVVGPRLGGGA